MNAPQCRASHGPMILRPEGRQTYEQRWCGTWYDCQHIEWGSRCGNTTLIQSPDLRASLAAAVTA